MRYVAHRVLQEQINHVIKFEYNIYKKEYISKAI